MNSGVKDHRYSIKSSCSRMDAAGAVISAFILTIILSLTCAAGQEETIQIERFHFSFSAGYYMNSGNDYYAERNEKGEVTVRVRLDGADAQDAPEIITDDAFMDELSEILYRYDVPSWDGFHENDDNVLDGDSFGLYVETKDAENISAGGYMAWPENYGSVKAELEELFVSLLDSVYPDHIKILEDYYQKNILSGQKEISVVEVSYPYIAEENEYFIYGQPDLPECILGHNIGNYTGGRKWDYGRDDADMIVLYLYREPSEDRPGYNRVCIRFELYTLDEDLNVQLLGEDWIENNACWNDGIYSYFFSHEYKEKNYLGYFSQKFQRAGGNTNTFILYLYELGEEGFQLIADEMLTGSLERDTWQYEDLEPFVKIAETYGFTNSLKYWEEHPFAPVIMRQDISLMLEILTTTNYGKGFLDALRAADAGDPVGDFMISGEIQSLISY